MADENVIRRAFRIGLVLKAAHSALELAGGIALALVSGDAITRFARALTQNELLQDPNDAVATFLLRTAQSLSIHERSAASIYLLSHGAVKLFLVVMLLREHEWAYPAFMAALCALIAYQSYQLTLSLSPWLVALTIFDALVLWLTVHEYRLHRGLG